MHTLNTKTKLTDIVIKEEANVYTKEAIRFFLHLIFARHSWVILYHKCLYYIHNDPMISDYEYDMIEKNYDMLANVLGETPTASDMVGFDETRRACKLVMQRVNQDIKNKKRGINVLY